MLFLVGPDSRYRAHIWSGSETYCKQRLATGAVYNTARSCLICRKCWDAMDDHARFEAFTDINLELDRATILIEHNEDIRQRAELRQMNTSQANASAL